MSQFRNVCHFKLEGFMLYMYGMYIHRNAPNVRVMFAFQQTHLNNCHSAKINKMRVEQMCIVMQYRIIMN